MTGSIYPFESVLPHQNRPSKLPIKPFPSNRVCTEDSDIEKLFAAIESKKTHKGCIARDSLLVRLALKTGMRRRELANLEPKDIHADFLVVVGGKGGKDRIIPLAPAIAQRLQNFIKGMEPDEKVFKLKAACISNKIRQFAKKAGTAC